MAAYYGGLEKARYNLSVNNTMSRLLPTFITALLSLCCVLVVVITLSVLVLSHWHGPFRDMWEIYPFLVKIIQHNWTVADLWESYGYAHRLFIPRLLYIADYEFADASNHLLMAVSLLCQLGICSLFAAILLAPSLVPRWQRGSLLLLVVIFQFSGTLLFNFMHTFDVQWFLVCFFVAAAFYLLSGQENKSPFITAVVSGILITAACLCNFSAMAAWPVWFLLLYGQLCQRRIASLPLALLLGSAILFMAVYGAGIHSPGSNEFSWSQLPQGLWYFLFQFPLLYLANPLSDPDYLSIGSWAVILLLPPLLLSGRFWWGFIKNRMQTQDRTLLFLAALMLFGVGVAVMTGLGRGYDPAHVRASRYQNIVMLFWSATLPFLFIQTSQQLSRMKSLWRFPGILFLLGLLVCQWQSWNENLLLGRNVARSHLALMMGYADDIPMISATVSRSMIYVPGYHLEKERLLHEQARKGIYADNMARDWLEGISLPTLSRDCGAVEWELSPRVTPYTRFTAFSVSGDTLFYDYAMLVEPDGKVVALAEREKPAQLLSLLESSPSLLRGFSRVESASNLVLVMVSSHDRCIKRSN